jgi:hypothetical protein
VRSELVPGPVAVGLAAAVACSGAVLLALQADLTFIFDEWEFLLYRRGTAAEVFLDPHNEHIVLAPVTAYKVLLALFGMDSPLPFQLLSNLVFLLSAVLLFELIRRAAGSWVALLGACLVLFLGPAWIDLLWPFQIGYFGSIAAGLGMMLALQRGDRTGDRLACLLLAVSLAFSSLGLAFAAGAAVDLALSRRHLAGRAFVVLAPLALFGLWWAGWGHTAESHIGFGNLVGAPAYVFDAAAQALASLLGLATPSGAELEPVGLNRGRVLLVLLAGLAALRLWRLGSVPRGLWIALAAGGAFWFLAALNDNEFRGPTSGRYQYPGAVFLLLIAAELLRGLRVPRAALVAATVLAAAALASNIAFLDRGHDRFFEPISESERAQLATLELARDSVDPAFTLTVERGGVWLGPVDAASYFSAIDAHGSPAYSEEELAASSEQARSGADQILAEALEIGLDPVQASGAGAGGPARCRIIAAGAGPPLRLGPGKLILQTRSAKSPRVRLGRFSDALPVDLGEMPARAGAITIRADRSRRRWRLGVSGTGALRVCGSDWADGASGSISG